MAENVQSRGQDRLSAILQERTRELTALYEEHAYAVYNVALRVTCERDVAVIAAERAFLGAAASERSQVEPIAAVVAAALAEAKARPSAGGAGGPEAEALLAAVAELPPPERAVLALQGLLGAATHEVAATLGLAEDAATKLQQQALEHFAERVGKDAEQAEAEYGAWLWAEPPTEIWEGLYPRFHRSAEQQARAALEAEEAARSPRRHLLSPLRLFGLVVLPVRALRQLRLRSPRLGRVWLMAVLPLLVVSGIAASRYTTGSGGDTGAELPGGAAPSPGAGGSYADDGKGDTLSPEELDKLRREELQDLVEHRKQELGKQDAKRNRAHRKFTVAERRAAARRRRLERLQRARLRALRRAAKERRADAQPAPRPAPRPRPRPRPRPKPSPPPVTKPKTTDDPLKDCLYNEEQSSYICPND